MPLAAPLTQKYIITGIFLLDMDKNETILEIIKQKGPILPVKVSKEIHDDVLMTSARLSELLTGKKIKISNLKVGGSPLYYFPGQEEKLTNFSDNISGTERKSYDMLQKEKILQDKYMEPATRVALRQIKDFAIPLQVSYHGKTEIFWKWFLTDGKEAESLIKEIITKKSEVEKKTEEVQKAPEQQTNLEKSKEELKHPEEILKKTISKTKKPTQTVIFLEVINNFLSKTKIKVIETTEVKKNSEFDMVVELITQLGDVKYFCKAKNKKKINEGDLSSALVNAQAKNLPLLFITNGTISKKVKEKLDTSFKNIVYREI
jgi:hypothetical protein